MGLPINIALVFSPPPSQHPLLLLGFYFVCFLSDIHVRRHDALKKIPIELPISNQIVLMQGTVAGLKRVQIFFKKYARIRAHKWRGKILLSLGGTLRKGVGGGVPSGVLEHSLQQNLRGSSEQFCGGWGRCKVTQKEDGRNFSFQRPFGQRRRVSGALEHAWGPQNHWVSTVSGIWEELGALPSLQPAQLCTWLD